MEQGILLVSWAGTIHLAKEMLETTLKDYEYPVVVAINEVESVTDHETLTWHMNRGLTIPIETNRWEMGAVQATIVTTHLDEFILIQDTLEIKDRSIFNRMFEDYRGRSVFFGPGGLCYLMKYRRNVLDKLPIPVCLTKLDAVYWEHMFPYQYEYIAQMEEGSPVHVLFPDWGNDNPKNVYDNTFDRPNLVLYNEYLIKRKSLEWRGPNNIRVAIEHKPS